MEYLCNKATYKLIEKKIAYRAVVWFHLSFVNQKFMFVRAHASKREKC